MEIRTFAPALTALMIVLAAGASSPAFAQNSAVAAKATAVAPAVDFRSSHWLSDRNVINNNGEDIAQVSDLILDRGSGHIEYVVIKTGTTFGLGGRAVAIPYSSFRRESGGKDRFVLPVTKEQLSQFPEYTPEGWMALKETSKDDASTLRQRLAADAAAPSDPYAGSLDTAKTSRIEGQISNVERVRTSTFGEQVLITVDQASGPARKIALGPSWFVNGAAAAPMRGDKVVVDTLALPRDPDQLLVATNLRTTDHELRLRATDGSPAWALKAVERGGDNYSTPYLRYLLMSHLAGKRVDCRGEECGKVNDIVIDRTSGEIGFLSIDPNQNFLGIGDTKRLIPWSVATVMLDGAIRLDASKEMVLASPETPSDLSTLNQGTHAERVYKAFNVPAPRFEPSPTALAVPADAANAWSRTGPIVGAIERDSAKTIEGKVLDISEVTFAGGVQPAQALKIQMLGDRGNSEVVLLGPTWYMQNQKPNCKVGDPIKVDVVRTVIDGHSYWMARSIDCKDSRVVLLDANNVPAWIHQ